MFRVATLFDRGPGYRLIDIQTAEVLMMTLQTAAAVSSRRVEWAASAEAQAEERSVMGMRGVGQMDPVRHAPHRLMELVGLARCGVAYR